MAHDRGKIILVVGSSGSGKGELVRHAFSVYPQLKFLISETTRTMRPGEVNGREYYFVSREEFERQRAAGEFSEWAEYGGNYYGTPKNQLIKALAARDVVLHDIEMQGVQQLMGLVPKESRTIVFIDAGSWDDLKERIVKRAPISNEELEMRRQRYELERSFEAQADFVIQNHNGSLEQAKAAFVSYIQSVLQEVGEVS